MFREQLISEIRKGTSSPAWRILVIASILAGAGIATLLAFIGVNVERSPLDFSQSKHLTAVVGSTATLTFTIVTIIGVIIVTSEYQSSTIGQTLLANPHRGVVSAAKFVWAGLSGLLVGVVSSVLTIVGLWLVLGSTPQGFDPTTSEIAMTLLGILVITVVWSIIGAGIGALVRDQLVAVITVIVVTQVIEPLVRLANIESLSKVLPSTVTDAVTGGGILSLATGVELLSQEIAMLVLVGGAVAMGIVGMTRFHRYQLQ